MARFEMSDAGATGLGEAPASADAFFELGMTYSNGRSVPADLVSAHKWFNLAAMKGHAEAARLRREVAAEMTDSEIGQAQRAARDWLKAHPEPVAVVAEPVRLRAA
jgi:TPR repeat protein